MSAFLKLANRQISAPASTAGKRARTTEEKEKVLAECAYTLRAWKRWRAEQREAALTGAHGALVAPLLEILDALTLRDGARLVEFIRAQDWRQVDADTKFTCLQELNNTITRLREQAGMSPFDDNLPGQPENAFRRIKRILFSEPALTAGAAPEPMPVSENRNFNSHGART